MDVPGSLGSVAANAHLVDSKVEGDVRRSLCSAHGTSMTRALIKERKISDKGTVEVSAT